ncbi:MAG TPA: hypothetical protein VL201_03175, partial [Patescibacteria group bacterium]|nr:hypothetical protein [Patescibacteria group bacterium]
MAQYKKQKKNDNVELFKTIKTESTHLKNKLIQLILLKKNNLIERTFDKPIKNLIENLENTKLIEAIGKLPTAQKYVLPELQKAVEAQTKHLDNQLEGLKIKNSNKIAKLTSVFNKKKSDIESDFIQKIKDLEEKRIESSSQLTNLQKEIDFISQTMNQQSELSNTKNMEKQKITQQLAELEKQTSVPYKELDEQERKIIALKTARNVLQANDGEAKAKTYYTAYEKWQSQIKSEGLFAQAKFLATSFLIDSDMPEEVKKAKDEFVNVINLILESFIKILDELNLTKDKLQEGFLLLLDIAKNNDMLSQEKFSEIIAGIDKSINDYDTKIKAEKKFPDIQNQKNKLKNDQKKVLEETNRINEKIEDLTKEYINKEKALLVIREKLTKIQKSIVRVKENQKKELAELNKELANEIKKADNEFTQLTATKREAGSLFYTTIDFIPYVKNYITQLKKLPIIAIHTNLLSIKLRSELFSLLPPTEQKITLDSLAIQRKKLTFAQKAAQFKQSLNEKIESFLKNTKSTTSNEKNSPNTYFTIDNTIVDQLHQSG